VHQHNGLYRTHLHTHTATVERGGSEGRIGKKRGKTTDQGSRSKSREKKNMMCERVYYSALVDRNREVEGRVTQKTDEHARRKQTHGYIEPGRAKAGEKEKKLLKHSDNGTRKQNGIQTLYQYQKAHKAERKGKRLRTKMRTRVCNNTS